jgi:hypothetical protein
MHASIRSRRYRRLRAGSPVLAAALLLAAAPAGAGAQATTVIADADAYVAASSPATNYAGAKSLRGDDTRRIAYVRFTSPKLQGSATKATLRIYVRTSNPSGFDVRPVASSSWNERTLTYRARPAVSSSTLARTGAFRRRGWLSLDVTRAVNGRGTLTLALVARRTRPRAKFDVSSREGGSARAPRLVIETPGAPAGTTVPPLPASLQAIAGAPPADPPAASFGLRPYDARSPWNMPIGPAPVLDPKSPSFVRAISDNDLPLTSDPDQYAIPVYSFTAQTPRRTVKLGGWFSSYDNGDNSRVGYGFAPTITNVPVPDGALQSAGSDGQIVFWDPAGNTEYSFWQFNRDAAGNYTAENGNRYHTANGYYGRFADGLAGRGAGLPYLAGLVRRWEIDQGHIDHALAFAYRSPSSALVYPASKSDGANFGGVLGTDLPEGARLQLDPAKTDTDFNAWGLSPAAKTIARALQSYGMYVVDNSGSSKIYLEDRLTAGWDASIDRHLTEKIPWTAFRVIEPPPQP